MKKILVINCHPNPDSYNAALAAAYATAARKAGFPVAEIALHALTFSPLLAAGNHRTLQPLEPDLAEAQQKILWADHLVWVHPVWWGGQPALMKGFIDRVFLPGFAFKYRKDSVWWDRLLKGRTARIITTMDQPRWYYWLVYRSPSINQFKKLTLEFCGIRPVKVTSIGPVHGASAAFLTRHLNRVTLLGEKGK